MPLSGKTEGWQIGNPYLKENGSLWAGFQPGVQAAGLAVLCTFVLHKPDASCRTNFCGRRRRALGKCYLLAFAVPVAAELLIKATFLLTGDQEGVLIVPWPP